MKSANELLYDIYGLLTKIAANTSSTSEPTEKETSSASPAAKVSVGGMGTNLSDIVGDKTKNENVKDTAESLKILSESLSPLSAGLWKFGLIPKTFKRSLFYFLRDMLDMSKEKGMYSAKAAKTISESINILSDALPKLAKGVLFFGIMSKTGLTNATAVGITSLGTALAAIGNPATAPFVLVGAAALASIGVALQGVASVLSSISLVMLSFSASIVLMVGSIWLASKLFNVGPLESMGIIVGSIAILAGGFALLGLMSPLIAGAGVAVSQLGIALTLTGIGILSFVGLIALANAITGSQENTNNAILSSTKSLVILSLAFSAIGLLSPFIFAGAIAVKQMGVGLLWVSGGMLALGASYALTTMMGVDYGEMIKKTAFGILALGGAFALVGILSPFILLGSIGLISISLSLGLFALLSLGINAVITKLGGEEGIGTMTNNISLLVGGVLRGVIDGISEGLLGEKGNSKNFFGKILTVGKNVMTLIGGLFLLMGVSYTLGLFALTLHAFTKVGVIKDVKGKEVNVINVSRNIAKSIGSFFRTLTTTFKDPSIIPNQKDMENIATILLGRATGIKYMGIRVIGERKPGLIDAIAKFAEVIALFAKFDQIPVYEVDKDGKAKIKSTVQPTKVARTIVLTLKEFFKEFEKNQTMLNNISTSSGAKLSQILLGSKLTGLLGYSAKWLGLASDTPGLLTPIMKFTETVLSYAKMGTKNELATEFDKNGAPTKFIPVETVAKNMVTGITSFMRTFNAQMGLAAPELNRNQPQFSASLEVFTKSFEKLADLGKNLDGINKLSISIGSLANNIGRLSENMNSLDASNLNDALNKVSKVSNVNINSGNSSSGNIQGNAFQQSYNDQQLEKLATMIASKITNNKNATYDFIFHDTNRGKLEIKFN